MAATALAHARQHGFDHRHRAKHIDVKLAAQLCKRGFFQNAFMAVTGIVHQHIYRTDGGLYLSNHLINTFIVRDIKQIAKSPLRIERGESLQCFAVAHRPYNPMPYGEGFPRQRLTKATADAGN